MKEKREIALNFLPLNTNKFNFKVWAKLAESSEKRWSENIRKYRLPDKNKEYVYHWVSFEQFKKANQKEIQVDTNLDLTKYYLFYLLKNKLTESKIEFIQKENEKRFSPNHLYIIVEETEYGKKAIRIEPYYLKIKQKFGFLIDYRFLKEPEIPFNTKIQQLSFSLDEDFKSNVNFHIDKFRFIDEFLRKNLYKFSKIRDDLEIQSSFEKLDYSTLNLRKYIFANNETDNSQYKGINKHGPFKKVSKKITYYYIYHKDHIEYVNDFIKALNGETFKTFEGLKKFHLPNQTKVNTKGIPIKSFSEDVERYLPSELEKNYILIAILPSEEEKFYFNLKNICLRKNIPLQVVHLDTIINKNKLKWSIAGIALQILAKLGGIPWIVKAENTNCLIIGIGQSVEKDNERKLKRFLAYSVLLDSSGKFLTIEPIAEATNKNEYLERISQRISEIIKEKYSSYKKIVFHIPEKIKLDIIKKIENVLKKIKENIELYIIRLNDESKFFGYNIGNNSLIPYESSYIKLSKKEFLLWTEGLNDDNSTAKKRYGNPIYIEFYYPDQNNVDYESFLQDILNLSGINYRGFNAKSLPVSVFYPKLISKFYKYFNKHNLQIVIEKKERMWFL